MPHDPAADARRRPSVTEPEARARQQAYWRTNVRYVSLLLVVWFAVSYVGGILLVKPLNAFRIPGTGYPLGFWLAQQGSIFAFVVLIFLYVWLMNRLDRAYDLDEGDER